MITNLRWKINPFRTVVVYVDFLAPLNGYNNQWKLANDHVLTYLRDNTTHTNILMLLRESWSGASMLITDMLCCVSATSTAVKWCWENYKIDQLAEVGRLAKKRKTK